MNGNSPRERAAQQARTKLARPPALVLRAELEQPAKYMVDAETLEDEQRLLISLRPLPRALRELADDLERILEERVA
jgi:hypothetical protein